MLDSFALRTAIYARLDGQLTTPVYSYVPQNSVHEYVVIGDVSAVTDDTMNTEMQRYSVTLHTFSKNKASTQSVEAIMSNVYSAMHNYALAITGYNVVQCRQENINMFQQGEPNDRYWHGVQEYSLLVEDV